MTDTAQQAERSSETGANELSDRTWAVISFERCEASGLTYHEAAEKLRELDSSRIAGLCVVTAETAARVRS